MAVELEPKWHTATWVIVDGSPVRALRYQESRRYYRMEA